MHAKISSLDIGFDHSGELLLIRGVIVGYLTPFGWFKVLYVRIGLSIRIRMTSGNASGSGKDSVESR